MGLRVHAAETPAQGTGVRGVLSGTSTGRDFSQSSKNISDLQKFCWKGHENSFYRRTFGCT